MKRSVAEYNLPKSEVERFRKEAVKLSESGNNQRKADAERIRCLESAIDALTNIPEKQFTSEDWQLKAECEYHIAHLYTPQEKIDSEKGIEFFRRSIDSYGQIPAKERSEGQWKSLAYCQVLLAEIYMQGHLYQQAECYCLHAFDSTLNVNDSEKCRDPNTFFRLLGDIYNCLSTLYESSHTLIKDIYLFASNLFSEGIVDEVDFIHVFPKLHFAVLKTNPSPDAAIHRAFLKLMEAIEKYFSNPNFGNLQTKAYLNDPAHLKWFQERKEEVKQVCDSTLLVDMIDSVPFYISVAHALNNLKARVSSLEEENKHLKESQKNSVYGTGLTAFSSAPPPSSSSSRTSEISKKYENN
jgi:hypothetical protein